LHNLKHNKILHERVIFLTITTRDVPFVQQAERVKVENLNNGFYRIEAFYGFKDEPDIQDILKRCEEHQLTFNMMDTSFFVARETVIPSQWPGMASWREHLFAWMSRNAIPVTDYFHIPPNRVVELGTQVEI
jgi:KUP system potassium uptake protein